MRLNISYMLSKLEQAMAIKTANICDKTWIDYEHPLSVDNLQPLFKRVNNYYLNKWGLGWVLVIWRIQMVG